MEKNSLNLDGKKRIFRKKILSEIIFTRSLCTLGIIIFHYFAHSNGTFKLLYKTANSAWGFILVTTFFNISGSVLYYNYPKIDSLKRFYYKRWKSIFPSFYICYFYFFIRNSFVSHKLIFNGHWSKLIFTLIGLDGYLNYRIRTYYLIGEWFLGAIIIIYLLYPLLLWLMNKHFIIVCSIFGTGYFVMYKTDFFIISKTNNLITCIISFYFGMYAIYFKKIFFGNKIIFVFSAIIFIFLDFVELNSPFILIFQVQGFSLYLLLIQIGKYIMVKNYSYIFSYISNLSYSIYLLHHHIINDIQGINNPKQWYWNVILLGLVIIFTFISSTIHMLVMNDFINGLIFRKLDSYFLI